MTDSTDNRARTKYYYLGKRFRVAIGDWPRQERPPRKKTVFGQKMRKIALHAGKRFESFRITAMDSIGRILAGTETFEGLNALLEEVSENE